ncbi:MAG TPA: spore protease YyaC, partial [Calditerricola sp.]
VHAVNLVDTIGRISRTHRDPYILALDACLGQFQHIGTITLDEGPVKPGAGVQKNLPAVGSLHMTGIVNVGGFMEYFVLQNTRLSVVMKMADVMAKAILHAARRWKQKETAAFR